MLIYLCPIQISFEGRDCGQDLFPVSANQDKTYGDCDYQARNNRYWSEYIQ